MAAFRRVAALAGKITLWSAARAELLGGRRARGCAAAGLGLAAGGAAALYLYMDGTSGGGRRRMERRSINGLLPSIAAVEAKEKARPFDFEDGDVYMSSHEHRFRMFSSAEYDGQLYMTPQNFIESVTMSEPRNKRPWRSLAKQELEKILSETPPVWRGSSKLFRNLRERGIISYTEYLFLLCILTKPHAGFKIAFNMFDADGNQMVDKREFLVVLKKDSQEFVARSYWDVLRRSASQVLFSDLAERADESITIDTTLLVHFFGKKGKAELTFDDFYRFMDNLQTEVLEIEFLTYSKGMTTISEEDFAKILLRFTNVENISAYLENGITFDEFRSFFQFLNNLEDFAIAMQMYNFASRSIGQDEFARAVYVATGLKLTRHLVHTIFKIFDVDHDDQLSYKEFIGIMKDRLHRGGRSSVGRRERMNWLFPLSKGSGPLPPLSSLQQQRQRQIESLKAAHASLAEIQKDVEYRIPFTVNNSTINVNILLPPQFPQEKPVVSVYPPVGHHLVDGNNGTMITSPLITNFGMHSDLGKVIQSLLDEFWKSPPALMSTGSAGFPYSMYKPSGIAPYPTQAFHYGPRHMGPSQAPPPGPSAVPSPAPHPGVDGAHGPPRAPAPYGLLSDLPLPVPTGDSQAGLNGHMYKMPEIPESFPELCDMNLTHLSDMSENEDLLLEFFVSLPQLKQVTDDKEELVTSIVDMAKKNLQMEPQLEGKRQEMLYKYEQLTHMKSAFETKMQRQHELSESCSLNTLQARLKVAAHQAEEESEETAENFLEGRTDIDEFLTSFMEKRTSKKGRTARHHKTAYSTAAGGGISPYVTNYPELCKEEKKKKEEERKRWIEQEGALFGSAEEEEQLVNLFTTSLQRRIQFVPSRAPSRDMAQQMGDGHRRFLQTMMANGVVDEQGARSLHQHCCETHNTQYARDKLDDFIAAINSKLQPMFMQIRKGMSEDNGQQYYALVNMAETDVTRMSSDYADNELELFRKTMDLIVGTESGKASSTDILNSADTLTTKKLKKSETEHLLNRLVHGQWLSEKRGEYTLSTRCIIEMEPYIRTMYQDQVKVCQICHNIAFQPVTLTTKPSDTQQPDDSRDVPLGPGAGAGAAARRVRTHIHAALPPQRAAAPASVTCAVLPRITHHHGNRRSQRVPAARPASASPGSPPSSSSSSSTDDDRGEFTSQVVLWMLQCRVL
ncbi:hypothetical protein F2P81_010500 [Scophthalmus maximus]|uniref:Non-structural maintenance of chromosomes element 1 homolog n=1 Tax=Scophthalmus maximus TaxID=52904 RepID=A0A6A4SR08_SCOMX|nr:hypothetical protein F2P81_010500 [Scophthalmus maximus]